MSEDFFEVVNPPPRHRESSESEPPSALEPRTESAASAQAIAQIGRVSITQTGLVFPDQKISADEWMSVFDYLQKQEDRRQLMIGDLFAYGSDDLGFSYDQIAQATGYKIGSIKVFASVCRSVPQLIRLNSSTFSHCQKVAPYERSIQIQALQLVEEKGWSVSELEAFLNKDRRPKSQTRRASNKLIRPIQIVDRSELRRARATTPENRQKIIADLRQIIDELESLDR